MVALAAEQSANTDGNPGYETLAAAAEVVLDESLSAFVGLDAIEAALDPAESVASRDSAGGPAPAAVEVQLSAAEDGIAAAREELGGRRERVADAAELLREEVATYV
jgi:argininosuccinate lyase